jgi:hypothetical protein
MVKIYDNPADCLQDTEGSSSHLSKFFSSGVIKKLSTPPGGVYGKNFGLLSFSLSHDLEMSAE